MLQVAHQCICCVHTRPTAHKLATLCPQICSELHQNLQQYLPTNCQPTAHKLATLCPQICSELHQNLQQYLPTNCQPTAHQLTTFCPRICYELHPNWQRSVLIRVMRLRLAYLLGVSRTIEIRVICRPPAHKLATIRPHTCYDLLAAWPQSATFCLQL